MLQQIACTLFRVQFGANLQPTPELVKNGDLVPNAAGMITKQQTFDALMHVGISKKVATETTDANFDHLSLLFL